MPRFRRGSRVTPPAPQTSPQPPLLTPAGANTGCGGVGDQAPRGRGLSHRPTLSPCTAPSPPRGARPGLWPISEAVRETEPCYWLILQRALPESRLLERCPRRAGAAATAAWRLLREPPSRGWGAAMAGSPGSEASLEGVSLGSSEEADLRREGRERRGGEAGGKLAPSSVLLPRGLGVRRGCPGSGPPEA